MTWFQHTRHFCKVHQFLLLYLTGATIVLLIINDWFWPTSDEYFYATLARNFRAAFHGQMALGDINTEHVGLVAFLVAIYQELISPTTLLASRVPIFGFSLGIIILIYGIAQTVGLSVKERRWWLVLLLLIPGYWVFSVRLMLDIPGTFGAILVLYLLLKKAPSYQVGLGLLVVLLLKEYYVFLMAPIIVLTILWDAWQSSDPWLKKISTTSAKVSASFLPIIVSTVLLLDSNWLPYPRALELNLIQFFGDLFRYANKTFLSLLNSMMQLFVHPATETVIQTVQPTVEVVKTTLSPILSEPTTVQPIIDTTTAVLPTSLEQSANAISLTGTLPTNLFDTDPSPYGDSFLTKLWYVYQYNFSETDINVFMLPAAGLGLWLSLKKVYLSLRKPSAATRTHLIFILYFLMFAYFNYYEASFKHGFRITLPIIIALIFFSHLAAEVLLKKINLRYSIAFAILSIIAILLYAISLQQIQYGSVLSHQGIFVTILNLKPYIMVTGFSILLLLLLVFPKLPFRRKNTLLIIGVLSFFFIKLIPFYFENQRALNLYDFDYGLDTVTPLLAHYRGSDTKMLSNMNSNKLQYYAGDFVLSTMGVIPMVHTFSQGHATLYYGYLRDGDLLDQLVSNNISVVLLSNDDFDEQFRTTLDGAIAAHPAAFTKLFERYHHDRLQWAIYRFDAQAL